MDDIEEAKKLLKECSQLKNEYLESHRELYKSYFNYKKIFNNKLINKSNNAISDLKLLLAYMKKHNELKMVYHSYKNL